MPATPARQSIDRDLADAEHFGHVLDYLFLPAVLAAGFDPWPPATSTAELVHMEFGRALCTAELVLVDMSSLNANVFFELGIRTALNRPICLVRDDHTDRVPVHVGVWNCHRYSSALRPWEIDKEIAELTEHISTSAARSRGHNAFWQRFGRLAEKPDQCSGVERRIS